jgi:hypothetical protein
MYFEARSEGPEGMRAVGSVVLNRIASDEFPGTACAVVYEGGETPPCQFSWWCDGRSDAPTNSEHWETALALAAEMLEERGDDPTDGALFFHSADIPVPWQLERKRTVQILGHVYYRCCYASMPTHTRATMSVAMREVSEFSMCVAQRIAATGSAFVRTGATSQIGRLLIGTLALSIRAAHVEHEQADLQDDQRVRVDRQRPRDPEHVADDEKCKARQARRAALRRYEPRCDGRRGRRGRRGPLQPIDHRFAQLSSSVFDSRATTQFHAVSGDDAHALAFQRSPLTRTNPLGAMDSLWIYNEGNAAWAAPPGNPAW